MWKQRCSMGFLEVALSVLRKFDDKFQLRQTLANDSPQNILGFHG